MECKKIKEQLADFFEGDFEKNTNDKIEKHLSECSSCKIELDQIKSLYQLIDNTENSLPPEQLDNEFYNMLENQKKHIKPSLVVNEKAPTLWSRIFGVWEVTPLIQLAAAIIILITGLFIGLNIRPLNNSSTDVSSMQEEIKSMKEMLMYSLIDNDSPSQRIKAVNYSEDIVIPDSRLVEVLIKTLHKDDNINVRMAAAYALGRYTKSDKVMEALITALEQEKDPGMQITIINLLAKTGDKNTIESFNRLIRKNETPLLVKDQAVRAMQTIL